MRARLLASLFLSVVLSLGVSSTASAYTDVFVFGDSLSDAGAFGHLFGGGGCPAAPYDGCRFSNGPTWAEIVTTSLGGSPDTVYAGTGGTNYAIGGERTDELFASGTAANGGQIPQFSTDVGGVADPNALYIVWAGGNNFLQNGAPDPFTPEDAAQDIVDAILDLQVLGATDFLIPNLPVAEPWGLTFNAELKLGLDSLLGTGVNIAQFDVFSTFLGIVFNPGPFGFTNVVDPCVVGGVACPNPDEYLLWDAVHPTTAAHQVLAGAALAIVPEPGTGLLVGLGLAMLAGRRTKRD